MESILCCYGLSFAYRLLYSSVITVNDFARLTLEVLRQI